MSSLKVGFIGIGNMGMPMARPLVKKGFSVTVRDLNQQAVEEIKALGAAENKPPAEKVPPPDLLRPGRRGLRPLYLWKKQ